jgi:hypothetical protein
MKYKALVSFTGLLSMAMGEVRDISDPSISSDLVKAGYIEEFKGEKTAPEVPKAEAPKAEAKEPEAEAPKAKKTTKPAKKRSSK